MSRGTMKNAVRGKSPVKYWLNWKGDSGVFQYWDGEQTREVNGVDLLVLDRRSTVTGWSDEHNARIFANSVKSLKEELNVRSKNATIAKGKWEEIKETVNKAGGNFTTNLYALARLGDSEEFEPVCVQLDKSCLKAFTDLLQQVKLYEVYKGLLHIGPSEQRKKGKVQFYVTEFELREATEEMNAQAAIFDLEKLQPYFNGEQSDDEEKAPF